jgi:multicomponent K+:H+ antiporter subunit A
MLMSLSAMAGGIALYLLLRKRLKSGRFTRPPLIHLLDGRRFFQWSLVGLSWAGRRGLRLTGTERLQIQVLCLVGLAFVAAVGSFRESGLSTANRPLLPVSIAFAGLWAIGMACAVGAALLAKYHRLAALTLAGGAGLVTCLTFVWFSAPDLALTQLTVEIVTTILILLGLRWLPKRVELADDPRRRSLKARARRLRDFVLAGLVGTGLAGVTYAVLTRPFDASISPFFLSRALPEGGGANVVNVMLVDFRGFDTLGEVTVLSAVALTVYALLRRFRPQRESIGQPPQQRSLSPDVVTDLVTPRAAICSCLPYWSGWCCRSPGWWLHTCSCAATTPPAAASSRAWWCRSRSSSSTWLRGPCGWRRTSSCARPAGLPPACCSRWSPGRAHSHSATLSSPAIRRTFSCRSSEKCISRARCSSTWASSRWWWVPRC